MPTFPSARYLFVDKEFERWGAERQKHAVIDYNISVFEDSIQPILDAGLAEIVSYGHEIAPGILIETAVGHTFGHSILRFADDRGDLVSTGD